LVNLQPLRGMPLTELEIDFRPQSDQLTVLNSMNTLKQINGQSAAKFLEEAKRRQEEARKIKRAPTQKFVAILISDPPKAPKADGETILTVQTREAVLVPNAYHAKKIVKHRLQYLAALRDPDLVRRVQRALEEQHAITEHQARLYTPIEARRYIDIALDAD